MNITINEVLQAYVDPLTPNEYAALERSLLAEGCRDALVLWGDVLIDGHNRYAICQKHGIPFKTVQNATFDSIDDVMLWMIDNHLARRSVSDFQRGVLALRKKEIVAAKTAHAGAPAADAQPAEQGSDASAAAQPLATREDIARAARVSSNTISQIEKIQKAATPELIEAVRAGTISINAAATVASLPEDQQVAAVAGGKKQLQLAAREIRAQRVSTRPPKETKEAALEQGSDGASTTISSAGQHGGGTSEIEQLRAEVARLKDRNAALQAENAALNERIGALIDAS
jgi:transcriptional regulator with XRE-family HTH domain